MIQRTFDTPGELTLDLSIVAGEVNVHATDTAVTTLEIEGGRDGDDLAIDISAMAEGGQRLVVDHRAKKAWGIFSIGVDLDVDVVVPAGTVVVCDAGSADVTIDGPIGSLDVRLSPGDVRFGDVQHDVSIRTASGDVKGGHVGGDLTVHGASGDVVVGRVDGAVVMRTASGDLRLGEAAGTVQVNTMSGDLQIRSLTGASAELRSVSGDVEVGVPEGRGVYLDLSSLSGDVRSDLTTATTPPDGPDLDLVASTVSGDIHVRRARRAAAIPPQAADSIEAS